MTEPTNAELIETMRETLKEHESIFVKKVSLNALDILVERLTEAERREERRSASSKRAIQLVEQVDALRVENERLKERGDRHSDAVGALGLHMNALRAENERLRDHLETVLDHIAYEDGEWPFGSARAALAKDSTKGGEDG